MERKKITGIVQKNIGRGAKLGFPTANIPIQDDDLQEGIYTALTQLDGETHKSIAFIGKAETFGESEKKLEVYILDFDRDIYGRQITVQLLEKLRDSQRFAGETDLVEQMKRDEQGARDFFKTYGRTE